MSIIQKNSELTSYYSRFGYGIVIYKSNNSHFLEKSDCEIIEELYDEFDLLPEINIKGNIIFVNFNKIDDVINLFDIFGSPIKKNLNYKLNWRSFPFKALLINNKDGDIGNTLRYIKQIYPIRFVPIKIAKQYAILRIHRLDDLDTLIKISHVYNEKFHILVQYSEEVKWIPNDEYGIKIMLKHIMSIERLHLIPLSKITYDLSYRLKNHNNDENLGRFLESAFRINTELSQSIQNLKYNLVELNLQTQNA